MSFTIADIRNKLRIFALLFVKRNDFQFIMIRVGILGGGQLGRMLLQEAANYPVEVHVMEKDENCPAANLCHKFINGDITAYQDVINFGKFVDVLTIEIENVNIEALEWLEMSGVKVIPSSFALKTIKNKIHQKEFYQKNQIQSSDFVVLQNKEQIMQFLDYLPAAQKLATGGYDGKGVLLIKSENDIDKGFDAPSVLEKMVEIDKEIALTVAVAQNLEMIAYPAVEMIFDPVLNLLDFQLCPANINEAILTKAVTLAKSVAKGFGSAGLFAVEMFVDKQGEVWVNETAPRVHNSGHHTIEAHFSSQFDMLWRILLDYPLGNVDMVMPSVMLNIIGAEGYNGNTKYEGMKEVLSIPNAFVHLYGKEATKPGRKMGHATLLGNDKEALLELAKQIRRTLIVKSEN
jgi:5-(carboxyamino)imidazole ribonucleotide synthase